MAPELKPEKEILLDEMLGESTRHTVIQLPSGAVVDNYTNLREKPQQERDMGSLDYGLSNSLPASTSKEGDSEDITDRYKDYLTIPQLFPSLSISIFPVSSVLSVFIFLSFKRLSTSLFGCP